MGSERVPGGGGDLPTSLGDAARSLLDRIAARGPVIHCLTNPVTAWLVAATVRALGAYPVMGDAPEEAAALARRADALVVNLGVPSAARAEAVRTALAVARRRGIPAVVDPVGVGASPWREALVHRILPALPERRALRLNLAEALALLREGGPAGPSPEGPAPGAGGAEGRRLPPGAPPAPELRGVESAGAWDPERAVRAARELADRGRLTAVLTGPEDVVAGEGRCLRVRHGHPLMAATVGTGCAATAAVACFLAVSADLGLPDPVAAAAAAAVYGLAGERAASRGTGPGSLAAALVDELYTLAQGRLPLPPLRIQEVSRP